ncbi:ATP-binding cassette domain-containing protein [candidate division NPL-UPA2 bacterium]|nr:ATP-binding cassette domain-containing protein [candidate division NPL-UPA2 bacterium]
MLKVHNLTKVYTSGFLNKKSVVAVDKISFDVHRGEIISLVGESGSGKTTTAQIILHLLQPTSGRVVFEGKSIWGLKNKAELKKYWQKVQGIFQDPYASFNPMYKAERMLYQAFNLLDGSPDNKKEIVGEALEAVGLRPGDVLGKYPHQLSGGQRQRLMIVRCHILRPKLILADEPVSMIDASGRAGLLQLFAELRDRYKTTIIFITHDLGLAYYMSDRILVMYKGRIVEEDIPEKILSHPQHPYTKKLIEDIPLIQRKWSDI